MSERGSVTPWEVSVIPAMDRARSGISQVLR